MFGSAEVIFVVDEEAMALMGIDGAGLASTVGAGEAGARR